MTIVLIGLLGVVALSAALYKSRSRQRRPKESPTLARVKKRHSLRRKLAKLVGDEFAVSQLVQAEAERLRVSQSSLEALESAITRVSSERQSMSQEKRRRSYISSAQAASPAKKPERDHSRQATPSDVHDLGFEVVNESIS